MGKRSPGIGCAVRRLGSARRPCPSESRHMSSTRGRSVPRGRRLRRVPVHPSPGAAALGRRRRGRARRRMRSPAKKVGGVALLKGNRVRGQAVVADVPRVPASSPIVCSPAFSSAAARLVEAGEFLARAELGLFAAEPAPCSGDLHIFPGRSRMRSDSIMWTAGTCQASCRASTTFHGPAPSVFKGTAAVLISPVGAG